MNAVENPPDFDKEVLLILDNGAYVVGRYHHVNMPGFDHGYYTVGKGVAGNDPHMTGKPVAWCELP